MSVFKSRGLENYFYFDSTAVLVSMPCVSLSPHSAQVCLSEKLFFAKIRNISVDGLIL